MGGDPRVTDMAKKLRHDAEYLAECQMTASGFWGNAHLIVGVGAAVAAAAAGASAFAKHTLYAAILSVAASVLSAALTWLKPGERATAHQTSGALYKVLADRAAELEKFGESAANGAKARSFADLADERDRLLTSAPFVNRRLCRRAVRFLDKGIAYYGPPRRDRQGAHRRFRWPWGSKSPRGAADAPAPPAQGGV